MEDFAHGADSIPETVAAARVKKSLLGVAIHTRQVYSLYMPYFRANRENHMTNYNHYYIGGYQDREDALNGVFEECKTGGHVAHIKKLLPLTKAPRIVAVRPHNATGKFTLDFQDYDYDLRAEGNTVYDLTEKQARKAIVTFFCGIRTNAKAGHVHLKLNQRIRPAEVLKVTPTRIRVEYELPTAGFVSAWRDQVTIGSRRYILNWA